MEASVFLQQKDEIGAMLKFVSMFFTFPMRKIFLLGFVRLLPPNGNVGRLEEDGQGGPHHRTEVF